ncbi:MAG TPA: glutaminyl-peptide cyclotransferase [Terracidiphilus sp.]|nr:glutaminyl-peptide cyclotransferase [Terracidiphilus sp.]
MPHPLRPHRFILLAFFIALELPAQDTYRVVHTYPHDNHAYTQGLIYKDGYLYESTGLNGHSSLRMVDLATGRVLQQVAVPSQYFAEGLTDWGSTLVQLTWQSHIGFVYDRFSFRLVRTFNYSGEGWGLTQDGHNLIMSDGSAMLRFLDPKTFREVRHIEVKDHGIAMTQLNELEYIRGEIYANVWLTDRIVRISPASGRVLGSIDLAGLLPPNQRPSQDAVLNGIAYDSAHDRLFVTGKLWPLLFEIKIVPKKAKLLPAARAK